MPADWKALYAAAQAFRDLAPWEWMLDYDLFGVQDPRTGMIGWCTVMGAGGEYFGLGIYRGDRGFDLLRKIHVDPDSFEDLALYGQDAMVLSFLSRDEVDGKQLKRIRALGLRPRGQNAWPVFESHEPGRLPVPLPEEQVGFCLDAVLQAIEVAKRARGNLDYVEPDGEGRLPVRVRQAEGNDWIDEHMLEPEPPEATPVQIDQLETHRTLAELPRVRVAIECDVFPMSMIIDGEDQPPYVPAGFMAVDARTGFVLRVELAPPVERGALARRELLATFEKYGAVPSVVVVCRDEVETALAPLASSLGFDLVRANSLPQLEAARTALEQVTRRGPIAPGRKPSKRK